MQKLNLLLSNTKRSEFPDQYERASDKEAIRIELAARDDFAFWSRKTFVKIIFYYKRNAMNEGLKRVGRIAPYTRGGRIVTRNLNLIPPASWPASRSTEASNIRFYDISRSTAIKNPDGSSSGLDANPDLTNLPVFGQWRSVGKDRISVITEVWDLEKKEWFKLY